jgi:hypothetical protein
MKRKTLICLLAGACWGFSSSSDVAAQSWVRLLGGDGDDFIWDAVATTDGGVALAGHTGSFISGGAPRNQYDGWVVKLHASGAVHWARTYGTTGNDWLYGIDVTDDGGFVVAADSLGIGPRASGWVIKLTGNGEIDWQRYLPFPGGGTTRIKDVVQTQDGGYALAGAIGISTVNIGPFSPWVIKLGADGTIDWQYRFGWYGAGIARFIAETEGGSFVAILDFWDGNDRIIQLAPEGELSWHRSFNAHLREIQPVSDGLLVTAIALGNDAGPSLLKLGSSGSLEWIKSLRPVSPYGISRAEQDGWVLGGVTGSGLVGWHGTAGGDSVWRRLIHPDQLGPLPYQNRTRAVMLLDQSTGPVYLIAGNLESVADEQAEILVAKLNEEGLIDPYYNYGDCDLLGEVDEPQGTTTVSSAEPFLQVYEGPATVEFAYGSTELVEPHSQVLCWGWARPIEIAEMPPLVVSDPAPVESGPPHSLRLPIEICFEIPGDDPYDVPGLPQPPRWQCNDDPKCPKCLNLLTDARAYLRNPPWRAKLYQAARPFVDLGPDNVDLAVIDRMIESVKGAPLSRQRTEEARESLISALARLRDSRPDRRGPKAPPGSDVMRLLAYTLNLIDLDLVAPDSARASVDTSGTASFDGAAWIRGPGLSNADEITLDVTSDVPVNIAGYRAGWPVVGFRFDGGEGVELDGEIDVSVYYGGLRFRGDPGQRRLLHWSADGCRDVTRTVNTREMTVTGAVTELGLFTVMQRTAGAKAGR